MKILKLKGLIVERGKTQTKVANDTGVHRATFARKMKDGGGGFTIEEVNRMITSIPLTMEEAIEIFFEQKESRTEE
ncbi:XRE family transcriptional regulator [Listeria rocourtiae]|uniref:XRE family transcriptional regulator n=1 Tax=Listeria rocourtiae TaxID=647910 RepID=UPI003D2F7166